MQAEELINQMIPPLKLSDSSEHALHWMNEFRISQLPVIENTQYKGILSESVIFDSEMNDKNVGEFPLEYANVFVSPETHYYEIIKVAAQHHLQILPVVDAEGQYLGVISVHEASAVIAQLIASQGVGGVIVLSMKEIDYSLAQVSRLVESNDAKIISSMIMTDERDSSYIKLTLKLNKSELSRVIATLERYDYKIIAHFQEAESIRNDKDRLDLLFKFLNI